MVNNASFSYASFTKSPGFSGALKDMIHRKYERVSTIKNVTLKVKAGEIIGLLGANGAGKTTLIKMLTGIVPTQRGRSNSFWQHDSLSKEKGFSKKYWRYVEPKKPIDLGFTADRHTEVAAGDLPTEAGRI
ncbi:hypothetical protein FD41_GL001494 [Lentilactobacillus farraginis DSM 18382 = JCM 14108]|uniref:ABC transporter, ATP-binding protein n=1 Tax=Lentilactobacillus farraginis DSM 18382 = JCM 14108 TaxID=1423743 RepID=X0PGR9_9LACO|nr:hypothetical protein FD41_GL001494 [Lentilactobacillus farraginis DSM 18382 = JCM 14108]GAF36177.1 ABC transporter, ATP-binding protein [Lentilactobacillus farraginis DSM 18382 = JCM 14108]